MSKVKRIIPKLEWNIVDEQKKMRGDIRKTICQCLDSVLMDFLKQAVLDADNKSEKRELALSNAEYAAKRTPELLFE